MRSARVLLMAAVVACGAAGSAWALDELEGDGLMPPQNIWPRWQGRLSLASPSQLLRADPMNIDMTSAKLAGASVLGDYYFTKSLPSLGDSGGFRATSGMFLGARASNLLSTGPGTGLSGRAFSVDRRSVGGLQLPGQSDTLSDTSGAVPYVGVGYTGLPSKGGWGFSADLGIMALSPGSAVKLGRVLGNVQNLDDVLRDMRLSPLVQVGVSYSF